MSATGLQLHCGYRPGCLGEVVALHARYYATATGFGLPFETRVATEMAAFLERYQPAHDLLLLAVQDGVVQGSVAIDGAHAGQDGAHLRWFIASDALRGQGVGAALLQQALAFVDARGMPSCYLWTFDQLAAARHLYLRAGFVLEHEARGSQWGREVTEQRYRRSQGASRNGSARANSASGASSAM